MLSAVWGAPVFHQQPWLFLAWQQPGLAWRGSWVGVLWLCRREGFPLPWGKNTLCCLVLAAATSWAWCQTLEQLREIGAVECPGEPCVEAVVEAPRHRAVVSKVILWAKEQDPVSQHPRWWRVKAGLLNGMWLWFFTAENPVLFSCCSGRFSSSFLPWAAYSHSVPEASMWSKPRASLFAETGGAGNTWWKKTGWGRVGHPSFLGHCMQAALDVLNAGLAWQERQDNSFVGTDVFQFSPANCWLCLEGKMSINSFFW